MNDSIFMIKFSKPSAELTKEYNDMGVEDKKKIIGNKHIIFD